MRCLFVAQIMAESADACLHSLYHYCHNPRLVPQLVNTAAKDRDRKIRACCQEFLRRLLAEWSDQSLERGLDHIADCIRAGLVDADK